MCPVSVSFSWPLAVSQILMVRSAEPVQNHSLAGSNATERTQLRRGRRWELGRNCKGVRT